jgi:methylenetetrahydrofolate reductase (NADPH)
VHDFAAIQRILEIERGFAPDDWKQFAREVSFWRPGEFFFYAQDEATGLADPSRRATSAVGSARNGGPVYRVSKWAHATMFTPDTTASRVGAALCTRAEDPMQGPKPLRFIEHVSKALLFRCKDCGDCSLPEIAYLCPESQCAKNQRNGPCGGTRDGRCEVDGYGDCIWLRAYERLKYDGRESTLLAHIPVVQDQSLRGTSSWANTWLGRDHLNQKNQTVHAKDAKTAKEAEEESPARPSPPSRETNSVH